MRNDFEAAAAAAHLPPHNPVQKKRADHARGKCGSADISDATGGKDTNISSFGTKKGAGSSGVSLRCHAKVKHDQLDKSQKEELHEWRQGQKSKGAKFKGKHTKRKGRCDATKAVASAVEKKVAEKLEAIEQEKASGEEAEAFIMSVVK
jgi:uncharacterized protein YaiL (DUF2058 family)